MSDTPACSCLSLTRLDGAAVKAYRDRFLQKNEGAGSAPEQRSFTCRECGTVWDETSTGKQLALLKQGGSEENVKE